MRRVFLVVLLLASTASADEPVLRVNLATALHLAGARPLDIALAAERVRAADAQLRRAQVLWLPTVTLGGDYFRHDGRIQDVGGVVFGTSRSAIFAGAGPTLSFAVSDAIFAPLAARRVRDAREAALEAGRNDALLDTAEAFFNVQQARGDLAAAEDVLRRTAELSRRADELGKTLVPAVEAVRVRTELSRRRQAVHSARARYRSASAELVRVLRLQPGTLVEPDEAPEMVVKLVGVERTLDELFALALADRPELAAAGALAEAARASVRQERWRPLLPGVLIRGASTNPAGNLGGGFFAGGKRDFIGNAGWRGDIDVQVVWELQNLGFGNAARIREREAERNVAELEALRARDRVQAEVTKARAELVGASDRLGDSEAALKDARESAELNLEGLGQTKRAGNAVLLVIRPQEAVAAVQALGQAYADFVSTTADYNRAQFRLYRAIGAPARALTQGEACRE